MAWLASTLLYAGLGGALVAAILAFRRPRRLRIAAMFFGIAIVGLLIPLPEVQVAKPESLLDQFAPVYQFHEFHSLVVRGSREDVYRAVKEVTADEIRLFQTLTSIRRMGRSGRENILNAPGKRPLLEVALHGGFIPLAERPNEEIVIGTSVLGPARGRLTPQNYATFREPGFALAAMNFRLEDAGGGFIRLTTETRVLATNAATRRIFSVYWRFIYPGSSIIRYAWLDAIRKRAQAAGPAP